MKQPVTTIPEFYQGKNVFVTGATGFVGKALLEKLLRSCSGIGTIYILIRAKRNKGLAERLKILTNDMLYERVKREQPDLKLENKIIPIEGDITLPSLGLSNSDRKLLTDNVHIIFHSAASVRFDDPLKEAIFLNVRGTREVCQLALETKQLLTYIHVSTAFANCDKSEAREILYPAKADWKRSIEIAENLNNDIFEALTEKYMDGMPNTYCFTKNLAEHVVHDMCNGIIPAVIVRPSIVINSMKDEPVAGWIDNFNGPIGLMTAYGKGIMRTIYAHDQYKPDYIPIDIVTKVLIISAWDRCQRRYNDVTTTPEMEIIQCTSHNAAEWMRPNNRRLATQATKINSQLPLNDIVWYPSDHTTNSVTICYIRTVLFMLIPALLVDGVLKLIGRKPMLMKLQRKMYGAQLALRYFLNNEWSYVNDRLLEMRKRILPGDANAWDYEFIEYDFEQYIRQSILGCRRYLLKEPDETIPKAKAHYKRMYWLHRFVQFITYTTILYIFYQTTFVQNAIHMLFL